ncbi:MAG TPA: DegT/DnrJ/EryC1/StrS aminotransferase family protein [Thermoanaerobaculia bacterium]|jgi:perosamine synthetase
MSQGVPYFRPDIGSEEIQEVVSALESGWLTTGPKVKTFEEEFAKAVGAEHAIAVNSCTAALHLAVEALGLRAGEAVVVPTMTFAATAEVVRYLGAYPLLVDCLPGTLNLDLDDARRKVRAFRAGEIPGTSAGGRVVGVMPVHVGGLMADVDALRDFATEHGLWIAEDAAHAFPASWRRDRSAPWQRCGEGTAAISCFSFYANKTITTGEGGMATTSDAELAARIRLMSLHGLSQDAWRRYSGGGTWDYRILAPGFKYNLTDVAAAIGIHQLRKAESMREKREAVAERYGRAFADLDEVETPPSDENRKHSWHLYPIRLHLDRLGIDRNAFIEELKRAGVGCSVHWRPLHMHPYYQETFGWRPEQFPAASAEWERLVSLPIFPGMREDEVDAVVERVRSLCEAHRSAAPAGRRSVSR